MFRQLQYQGQRFMSAIQAAGRAGVETWRGQDMASALYGDFSAYATRAARYTYSDLWYDNRALDKNSYLSEVWQRNGKLYKNIRSIYNPVRRLVDIEVSKVYGGQIDWTGGLRTGAIPVTGADKTLIAAITQILKWSNWDLEKDPYVRGGSKKGDRFLKIIDEPESGRVRMEVIDPFKVRDCLFDAVGNLKWIAIHTWQFDDEGKEYLKREEIDQNEFRFWYEYKWGIPLNFNRPPDKRYPNPYGFVPVKHVPHIKEDGHHFGRTSFGGGSLNKLIELNDQASLANDAARKALEPIYVARGTRIPDNDPQSKERDDIIVINIPKDGSVETITPSVDMTGMLGNIDRLLQEIENDNPQLALQHIREKGAMSGVAIQDSYGDAAGILLSIQGNCDGGFIGAMKMAISVAAFRRLRLFQMFDPEQSYQRGDLDFYLRQRDVFVDRISSEKRIQLLNESSDKPTFPIVARDLEYSDEDIALMQANKMEADYNQAAGAMSAIAEQAFGKEGDEPVMTDEEVSDA